MPVMPCSNKINECLPCNDDPIQNLSSEDLDPNVFCATVTFRDQPGLGRCDTGDLNSTAFCCSPESYMDAYLCALREAQAGVWGKATVGLCPTPPAIPPNCPPVCPTGCAPDCPVPPPTCPPNCVGIYYNTAQSCETTCSDGSTFEYTVLAGTISAPTVAQANYQAHALACRLAQTNKICITTSALDGVCINTAYNATLHATGGTPWFIDAVTVGQIPIIHCPGINFGSNFPYVWSIISGSLPTGLELNPCSGVISGTPTTNGVYTFTIKATDQNGGHQQKELSICVVEITTTDPLPPAQIGTAYSTTLNQEPGSAPTEVWTLISGPMPAGLSLNAGTGEISGTPTGPAQSVQLIFQVEVNCV